MLLIGSAIYALSITWRCLMTTSWESTAVLLILGFLLSWHVLEVIPRHADLPYKHLPFGVIPKRPLPSDTMAVVTKADGYITWGLLAAFALTSLCPANLSSEWRFALALWLFLLAPSCYLLGHQTAILLSVPFAVFTVLLPLQDAVFLIISQPLRLIATMLSVEAVHLLGGDVSYNLTTITLPDVQLGITDACSGIQQLEALLLLGYLLVRWQQKGLWWRLFHYAFIVPSVILANVLRLVFVILLYKTIGPRGLEADWHSGLGYVQVVLAILFLWLFGQAVEQLHMICGEAAHRNKGEAKK